MRILAMQSGTSMDGIDVVIADVDAVDHDAEPLVRMIPRAARTVPWEDGLREDLLALTAGEPTTAEAVCRLDARAGQAFAAAAAELIEETALRPELIVSHGQTVFHWVSGGHAAGTLQLGQPAWIAESTGVPVLSDVRSADIAAGGEGAPLMAVFDRAWLGTLAREQAAPVATLNLGGIANLQVVRPEGEVLAFDTGPANALIDAVIQRATDGRIRHDDGGRGAASGRVIPEVLERLLAHPYLAQPAPKSTGRETFDLAVVDAALTGLTPQLTDLLATLTAFSVESVALALERFAPDTAGILLSGGGVRNEALSLGLRERLAPRWVAESASRGVDPQLKEVLMFAFLGFLSVHGVPATIGRTPARVAGRLSLTAALPSIRPLQGVSGLVVEQQEEWNTA